MRLFYLKEEKMTYNYKIIDFLATRNVVEIKSEEEFDKFYEVLKKNGIGRYIAI